MCLFHTSSQLQFKDILQYPEIKITENKFTFLTGKSGCGKSTYLKILNQMILPENGSILYRGKEVKEYPILEYRKEVLLVPQEVFLLDGSIRENFDFYYEARETNPISDEDIKHFLNICCLTFSPKNLCSKMSGGEKQRVFLAIFLSFADKVLLLDEPTAALDEKISTTLFHHIREYCREKGITVICVSHNKQLIDHFADTIIPLEGKLHE